MKRIFYSILLSLAFIAPQPIQAAFNLFTWFEDRLTMTDISQTSITPIAALHKPTSIAQLQTLVVSSNKPIAVAAGRYSQGGQIAYPDGIVIDITDLNKVVRLDTTNKEITVETGITWRAIQNYIDAYNLSIKVMQSYNDFTVGGSLSVNVHGRDIHYGPLIETVTSIKVLLADGSIVTASRTENPDLFAGAIGGYGALGIIIEATISLTENYKIEQDIKQMPIEAYQKHFESVKNNPRVIFHNANLYPTDYKKVSSITWYRTDKKLTTSDSLQEVKKFYPFHALAEQILRRFSFAQKVRPKIDTKQMPVVALRNYEMSSTVNTLEPLLRFPTTTVLQEYFIPMAKLLPFINEVRALADIYDINILNISIRYIPQNHESILSYARNESFSLVFYINILNTQTGLKESQIWTQRLINAAILQGGTYYLPYQLFGTQEQIKKAYPRFDELVNLKKKYDPAGKFSNCLLKKYFQ